MRRATGVYEVLRLEYLDQLVDIGFRLSKDREKRSGGLGRFKARLKMAYCRSTCLHVASLPANRTRRDRRDLKKARTA